MSLSESFGHSAFARFINSPSGRIARIVAGLALIGWGTTRLPGTGGIVFMVVGLIPLAAGLFDLCFVSALLGGPIDGTRIAKGNSQS